MCLSQKSALQPFSSCRFCLLCPMIPGHDGWCICPSTINIATLMCLFLPIVRLCIWNRIFANLVTVEQCLLFPLSSSCQSSQVIYTANEEVARGLYNPAYKLLQMLPGPCSKGQLCVRRFHTIMQDLLQEVIPYLHCCQAVATYVATYVAAWPSFHHVAHKYFCALCQS